MTLHPGDAMTRRSRLIYIVVLGALTGLGPFTIDLYLPAFPLIAADLGVSAAAVQLTLTGTAVGFGLGQLLVGPWGDKIGRRLPLIVATGMHVLASLGALIAPDIATLTAMRLLQGVGASASGVIAMAVVRDLYTGFPLVRMLSRLALVFALAPVVAPLIGSQLLLVTDWRGLFAFLAAYGIVVLALATLLIRETLPPERRTVAGHATTLQRYLALFGDRIFVGVTLVATLNFAAMFAYLSATPFLFQDVYGLGPQGYALLFAINAIGVGAGVQISSALARRIGPQWILVWAGMLQLASSVMILVLAVVDGGFLAVALPLWFFVLATGLIFPCVQVLALVGHGTEAATAASLQGAAGFVAAGILAPVLAAFPAPNAAPMAIAMIIVEVAGMLALWLVVRPRTVPPLDS